MELFKLLYEGCEKKGFSFVLQVIALFALMYSLILLFSWIKKKIQESRSTNTVEAATHNSSDLLNHNFFRTVKKMINYDIHHIDIKERLRRALFRDFLLIKFTIVYDETREFIISNDVNALSQEQFHVKLHSLVSNIIRGYESAALHEGIPPIVIDKFNKWHSDQIDTIYKFVDDICEANDWYSDNSVKLYSFLNQMTVSLDITLINARKTLVYLNGDLNGLVYNGIVSEGHRNNK